MKRPTLNRIPVSEALPIRPATVTVTMGVGQWDNILLVSYELGFTLLELDDDEHPVAAYRNPHPMPRRERGPKNRVTSFM
jgi:hypothetical protein